MSHYIYQTHGFVLAKNNFGEAEQFISFYTQQLGGVKAIAKGVRLLKSKLRFSLDNFSYARLAFVRGREVWRLVDAQEVRRFEEIKNNPAKSMVFVNIIKLINRLVHGEERHQPLWFILESGFIFLDENFFSEEELKNFEAIMVLRILNELGYLEGSGLTKFLKNEWTKELFSQMKHSRPEALSEIKKGLADSHL